MNKKIISVPTERNKGLEPMIGKNFTIGYVPEIHKEDAIEVKLTLPIGAVKRLFKSYYEDIKENAIENVYLRQTSSYYGRLNDYAAEMIIFIRNQLNQQGLKGEELENDVFNQYFKEEFDEMRKYDKNHHKLDFGIPCSDPACSCHPK